MGDRPDTGKRNNLVMVMAASILDSKADYFDMVSRSYAAQGDEQRTEEWAKRAEQARRARDIIDENAGCWS